MLGLFDVAFSLRERGYGYQIVFFLLVIELTSF